MEKIHPKTGAPFVRNNYNYNTNEASDESALHCKDKSLAQQHLADECDINVIVARYMKTGELPQRHLPPMQGDFSAAPDFQTAMNLIVDAQRAFMEQPAEIRNRFGNNPAEFVAFCSDEKNRDEMRRMGLFSPEAVKRFELEAQTQEDLRKANAAAAEELKALKKGKVGDTQKGVT